MAHETLLKELKIIGGAIAAALAADKKRNKKSRNATYRAKRIREATGLWDSFNKKISEIAKLVDIADPCIKDEQEKYRTLYEEYTDRLLAIKDEDQQDDDDEQSDNDQQNDYEEDEQLLRAQSRRFVSLRAIITEVLSKRDNNEIPTSSYSEVKKQKIQNLWKKIDRDDESIDEGVSGYGSYTKEFETVENLMDESLIFLQEQLMTKSSDRSDNDLKLSRVEIKKFGGDYFEWVSFMDLFKSMVIDNKKLGDAQRMQLLKTHVTGEAEKLVRDLTISSVNFLSAWERLLNRYNNKRVIIEKMINRLLSQPVCKGDAKSIKQILDTTDQMMLALANMNRPTEFWNDWGVIVVGQKLTNESQKDWEKTIAKTTEMPTWMELKEFLEDQFRMLERLESSNKRQENKNLGGAKSIKTFQASLEKNCVICDQPHKLFSCHKWKQMEPKERGNIAKKYNWCKKCLRDHEDKKNRDRKCKKCQKGHSTWLHEDRALTPLTTAHGVFNQQYQVLLATAVIKTVDIQGEPIYLRALIDSGSEGSLITEAAAALLKIKSIRSNRVIEALVGRTSDALNKIQVEIQPRFASPFALKLELYILKNLTKMLPGHDLDPSEWKHIKPLAWADPKFYKRGPIDVLLGMDAAVEITMPGLIKGNNGQPMAQKTEFGWVMSGKIDPTYPANQMKCFITSVNDVNQDLTRFWEMEELNPERILTPDETACETFYENSVRRNEQDKFIVRIPFKADPEGANRLGESKGQAIARFLQMERKLIREKALGTEYKRVIQEYIDLGHMTEVTDLPKEEKRYYIPHHAVVKPDSLTTKVRVVFDASAKTNTGWSLYECMYTGAKQQRDLSDILINWRMHKVVYKADITKMYRMIELDPEDQKYHIIVWRNSPKEPLKEYKLTTTTFGTAAAPFLATRTLKQIAKEQKNSYPLAAAALENSFYVDDLIGGSNCVDQAIQTKNELLATMSKHHFNLCKWTSNDKEFLETLPPEMTEKSLQHFSEEDETSKALGLSWNPHSDQFLFKVNWLKDSQDTWTKRTFLAETSKLFDPLGWLAPVTINAKLMMQEVYLAQIGWDVQIPQNINEQWAQFRQEFKDLERIRIDRWLGFENGCELSLHGFSDASEKAYSAVVYARTSINGKITTKLITAKTRVASIQTKISLPRLELCGAVLVSNLMAHVRKALQVDDQVRTHLWTDSMITLGWINRAPNAWKTFVVNRVAEIQSNTSFNWDYVPSEQNPADCASRGLMPRDLLSHPLWWTGPHWLQEEPDKWPTAEIPAHNLEQRNVVMVNTVQFTRNEMFERYSSWDKLTRLAAYGRRFKNKLTGPLTVAELQKARLGIIRKCQEEAFPQEMYDLQENKPIQRASKLISLNVFLDENGIMRVGGRLVNASIPYGTKHPIVLPEKHHITTIIIQQMHRDTHHGGPKLMRSLLSKKFWIIQGKRMITAACSSCINCRRLKGVAYKQQMGNLPEPRVTLQHPFSFSGVDYAGPVEIKSSKLRGGKILKGYIAVYVCMGTKAVHLELVSDQTSEAFLASFNRFTARRGLPTAMYSDNGTNFEGANNQLQRLYLLQQNQDIAKVVVNNNVEWHFIPPGAPNFGGLWERSIRSMKEHLKRTLQTARLTFEEYSTLLCQVEACLNSRPLCSVSDDIENLDALTPGHFLIGQALVAPPQPNVGPKLINHRNRWIYVSTLHRQLWNRWNSEYLLELQQRYKWQETSENAKPGDLVVIKDEDVAPRNWVIGRIEEVQTGKDDMVRVATIRIPAKTTTTESSNTMMRPNKRGKAVAKVTKKKDQVQHMTSKLIKRPIRKLCPLITDVKETELRDHHEKQVAKEKPVRHTYNLRTRTAGKIMTIALVFFGILFGTVATSNTNCIEVKPFEYNSGLYFQHLGMASIAKSEWKILVFFELDKYNQELQKINETVYSLSQLCQTVESSINEKAASQCNSTVTLLQHQLTAILEMNDILQWNKQAVEINRKKRAAAPFNFIGWLGHELFGIMDAATAQKWEQQIIDVKSNQFNQQKLMYEQKSIIELTANLMKETKLEMESKIKILKNAIIKLNNETDLYRKREQIIGWSLYAFIIINTMEKVQQNMVDMLTDLQQGHVSSYLFTPKQFKKELDTINDKIPNGQKLPVNPQRDMKSFYEIMRGRMRVTKTNILLEITLPLISIEEFQVFQLIPIPIEHNNEHVSIIPESQYLLITLKRDLFYQMDENELNNCIQTQDIPLICPALKPVHTIESTRGRCERELLAGTTQISEGCVIKVTASKEVWIQLKTTNMWVYGLKNATTLNVVRSNNVDTVTLQGDGIRTIQAGCEVSHDGFTIIGKSQIVTNSTHDFTPTMNLSNLIKDNPSNMHLVNVTMNQLDKLKEINRKVVTMDDTIERHHTLHGAIQIALTLLVIFIGITIIIISYKSRFNQWWWLHRSHQNEHVTSPISQHNNYQMSINVEQTGCSDGNTNIPIKAEQKHGSDDNTSVSIKAEQKRSSDDSIIHSEDRHGLGGCPFRT